MQPNMGIKKRITSFSRGKIWQKGNVEIIGSKNENGQDIYHQGLSVCVGWISAPSPVCVGQLEICYLEKSRSLENVPTQKNFTSWPEESREAIPSSRLQGNYDSIARSLRLKSELYQDIRPQFLYELKSVQDCKVSNNFTEATRKPPLWILPLVHRMSGIMSS